MRSSKLQFTDKKFDNILLYALGLARHGLVPSKKVNVRGQEKTVA